MTSEKLMDGVFIKSRKFKKDVNLFLDSMEQTRVAECIKKETADIKKRHPDWTSEQIHKKAQTACGQKTSVQIKDKKKNAYLEKYDQKPMPNQECVSRKISIFAEEHPEWEHEQVIAAAISWCRENSKAGDNEKLLFQNDSDSTIQTFKFIKKNLDSTIDFTDFIQLMGFNAALEDTSTCHKMSNVIETDTEYIVPVVLAKAMVQPYPNKGLIMAKKPEDLAKAVAVDYESGNLTKKLPTFEFHPEEEKRENENGYVEDIRYQKDKERIVGLLHVSKKRLSDNLRGYFERGEQIHVSIGFMYVEGPGGTFTASTDNQWNGESFDACQRNILLTHLALLPPNRSRGRCPLPYCGVGINVNDSISLNFDTFTIDTTDKYTITDYDGIIDVGRTLFIRTEDDVINVLDALQSQNREIQNLKKTIRKYLIQLAQALNK